MQFKGCREVSRLPMGLVRNWDIRTFHLLDKLKSIWLGYSLNGKTSNTGSIPVIPTSLEIGEFFS